MVESNQIPRKRMRFSLSSSVNGILTAKKLLKQRDRSDRLALAVSQIRNGSRVHHSTSFSGKIDSKAIRTYPRVTTKDLHLRRVFSPSSISSDWEFNAKDEHRSKNQIDEYPRDSLISNTGEDGSKANAGGLGNAEAKDFLHTTPPVSELSSGGPISAVNEAERTCQEINRPAAKKLGTNPNTKSVLHPCSRAKIFKNPGSVSYKRLLPYLMQAADDGTSSSSQPSKLEKCYVQNLPSTNITCDKESGEIADDPNVKVSELMTAKCQSPKTPKPVLQSVDRVCNKHSAESLCGNTSPLKSVITSSPNKKPVYSRRKLFKTPGSVNYRRMLPYLRDIKEDNPCMSETVNHPDHQKNLEEIIPSSTLISETLGTQDMVSSSVAKESDTCSNENKEPIPCERVSVSPEWSHPDKEQETQVKYVIPNTEKSLGTPHNVLGSEILYSSPLVGSRSRSEVASSSLHDTLVENLVGKENMNGADITKAQNSAKQLEANDLDLTTKPLKPSVTLTTPPSISPSKGILKRRGCRGICSCLNCSSFRLNAERAFEFSRNQLQDTEVMVLDLVGEITHLRDMLEKHNSADHNDSYKSQAGEAAKRACEAAELAKGRLQQMNNDLQVHCRIPNEQRARVKFAHYVHEKTM